MTGLVQQLALTNDKLYRSTQFEMTPRTLKFLYCTFFSDLFSLFVYHLWWIKMYNYIILFI